MPSTEVFAANQPRRGDIRPQPRYGDPLCCEKQAQKAKNSPPGPLITAEYKVRLVRAMAFATRDKHARATLSGSDGLQPLEPGIEVTACSANDWDSDPVGNNRSVQSLAISGDFIQYSL